MSTRSGGRNEGLEARSVRLAQEGPVRDRGRVPREKAGLVNSMDNLPGTHPICQNCPNYIKNKCCALTVEDTPLHPYCRSRLYGIYQMPEVRLAGAGGGGEG